MRALIPILISFALPLQSHGIAGTDTVVTAYPQAPEFLETAGTTFAMTEEEYRNVAEGLSKSSWFVAIKNHPKNLTAHARYGYNLAFGGINHCWILDGDEKQGYVLYPDLNANGNPADDSTLRFTLDQGRYAIRLQTTAAKTQATPRKNTRSS